jgi:hypothetical protein
MAARLQFAGKVKHRHRSALHAAPRVVGHHAQRHARVAHGAAYAAQRVGHIPGAHGAGLGRQAAQAVEVVGARGDGEALEHLRVFSYMVLSTPKQALPRTFVQDKT